MISFASRPSRIFIRSDDAIDRAGTGTPSNFVLPLVENILDAKAVQLLGCRIPNVMPQVPDYQRYFVYQVGGQYRAFMLDHNVPYSWEYYADYTALAAQLTLDAGFWIPYVGVPLTRADFVAAVAQVPDVSFAVNAGTRKIEMTNLNAAPVTLASEAVVQGLFRVGEIVKPYLYLNFLLGYETRPSLVPTIAPAGIYDPPSFANLIPTQTIYIATNMVMNGTYTSNGQRNILQTIPVDVPTLATIVYQSSQRHYIYSVPQTIGTITIELLDENGQPIYLPENAQTEYEIGIVYEGEI